MKLFLVVICAIGIVQALPAKQSKVDVQLLNRLLNSLKTLVAKEENNSGNSGNNGNFDISPTAAADFKKAMDVVSKLAKDQKCTKEVTDAIDNVPATTTTKEDIVSGMKHMMESMAEWHNNNPNLSMANFLDMQHFYNCEYLVVHTLLFRLHFFGEEGVGVCFEVLQYQFIPDLACCPAIWTYIAEFEELFIGQISYVVMEEQEFLTNLTLQDLCDGFSYLDFVAHTLSDLVEFASERWCGIQFGDNEQRTITKQVNQIHNDLASKFGASSLAAAATKRRENHPIMKKHVKASPWR